METRILDAVCILPRIELLNRYVEEEIDQLEQYLRSEQADEHIEKICDRIRMLAWMQEDISSKAFKDVNTIINGSEV